MSENIHGDLPELAASEVKPAASNAAAKVASVDTLQTFMKELQNRKIASE